MDNSNIRSRRVEDDYFRRKEMELIQKLREQTEKDSRKKELAESLGVGDEVILEILHDMGFDRDTITLLYLMPLLQVAWSDGHLAAAERTALLEMAHARGIGAGSPAHIRLEQWLDAQPDAELFERAIQVIRDLLVNQPEAERESKATSLVDACAQIASASGGFLGLGSRISASEKAVLDKVAAEIEKAHSTSAVNVTSKITP